MIMARFESDATDRYPLFEKWLGQDFLNVVSNPPHHQGILEMESLRRDGEYAIVL
jgi:hypothetical protein